MMVAFIDTNVLLHYPPLIQTDWCAVCETDSVTLMVCLPVVKELDRYKSDGRLGRRAQDRIKEISKANGSEIRPGVSVKVYSEPLRREDFPDTLSIDEADDKIVHFAKLYRDKEGGEVAVITEDYGMRLRCDAHNIPTFQPSQNLRLENPKTEEVRKLHEALRELQEIRNKLPDLQVIFHPGPDHLHQLRRPFLTPVPDALQAIRQSKRGVVSGWQASEFIKAAERRLVNNYNILDENARTIGVKASLSNIGHAPAKDITLIIKFPKIIAAIVYGLWLDGQRSKHEMGYKLNPELPDPVEPTQLFGHEHRPFVGTVSDGVFTFQCPQLPHGDSVSFDPFYLTFRSWEEVGPFEVEVSIRTLDPPDKREFTIPVRVKLLDSR